MTLGRPGRFAIMASLVAQILPAVACAPSAGPPLPGTPPVAAVTMREYRFDIGTIPPGRVVFQVGNAGHIAHRLSLVPLPADLPPILDQLRGTQRQVVSTLAAVPDTPPGGSGSFAVDLTPGRYALICFLTDPDGTSHAQKGMATEFRIP